MDDWPATVVFDLDGTLVDTMAAIPLAYADAIRDLGGPAVTVDDVLGAFHIGPTPVLLGHFLGRPATVADVEHFFRRYEASVAETQPLPGVVDLLDELARRGSRLGVFTSATKRAADHILGATGLRERFALVVGGDEVRRPKPAPDGLLQTCATLGAAPADVLYVGDADVDRACATAAGARFVDIRDALSAARRRGGRDPRRG